MIHSLMCLLSGKRERERQHMGGGHNMDLFINLFLLYVLKTTFASLCSSTHFYFHSCVYVLRGTIKQLHQPTGLVVIQENPA